MRKIKMEKIWRNTFFVRGYPGHEVIRNFLVEDYDSCVKVRAHFPKGSEEKRRPLERASL